MVLGWGCIRMTTEKIAGSYHFRGMSREQRDIYRKDFLEIADPTGFIFAEKWLEDGYRKWTTFIHSVGVREEVKEWQETLAVKLQAAAITQIATQRDSFQALKWLADRGWVEKSDKRTKEAKKASAKAHEEVQADMERLGLKLVKP